jgi:insertion element IS1 protein InsB
VKKNGHTHSGKQNFKCRDCGRQFVMNPRHQPISKSTRQLIGRLLLEKISLAGIVRATGVSERWLQSYVNQKLGAVKREVQVTSKKKGKLIIQCDEMWSFVGFKGNKQWIWWAIDVLTKEIVGVLLYCSLLSYNPETFLQFPSVFYKPRSLLVTSLNLSE